MKHIELLNLICKHKKILDEAYKNKKIISAPKELVQTGLFIKIDEYYYLNEIYINFANTLLARSEIDFIFEDFEKELKRVIEYKNEYFVTKNGFYLDILYNLSNRIFQGMKNRDKMILGLIVSFERDNISEIDILIKESTRILGEIENLIDINKKITNEFDSLKNTPLKEFIKDVLVEIVKLNRNIGKYLNRLKEFIVQTEKKRIFNKKLQKVVNLILKEDGLVEEFLRNKDFTVKEKVISVPDIIDMEIVKKAVGKLFIKKEIKTVEVKKPIEEVEILFERIKNQINKESFSLSDVVELNLSFVENNEKHSTRVIKNESSTGGSILLKIAIAVSLLELFLKEKANLFLILDEVSVISAKNQELLRDYVNERGLGVIYVTPDLPVLGDVEAIDIYKFRNINGEFMVYRLINEAGIKFE